MHLQLLDRCQPNAANMPLWTLVTTSAEPWRRSSLRDGDPEKSNSRNAHASRRHILLCRHSRHRRSENGGGATT